MRSACLAKLSKSMLNMGNLDHGTCLANVALKWEDMRGLQIILA